MATLKEIADRTGLSVSTISYVLNGKKKVKDETYQKIMDAVEELGYRPNQVARSLKTKRSLSIGVVVPDISNEFFPEIIKGIEDTATTHNYNIILCNTDNDSKREEKAINTLLDKDIDGIIFIGTAKSKMILEHKINVPIVLVDRKLGEQYSSIVSDNFRGGYLATEHLIKSEYKKIALLSGPVFIQTFFDRIRGYMTALQDNGMTYIEDYVVSCDFTIKGGYEAMRRLFDSKLEFDAIFATNDMIALGAIRALSEVHKKIPDDVALIGYDDITIASVIMPALTTIQQPKYEMGRQAAETLIKSIKSKDHCPKDVILQPTLIIRETAP